MPTRHSTTVSSIASVTLALAAGVGACIDLFHSTADVLTACQADPSLPGCTPKAGPASGADTVDVCASTPAAARQEADRACAWLGACEGPIGGNAFGPCTVRARMAYDCASNPAHRAAGSALAFWGCMLHAQTCADVGGCVFPGGPQSCTGGGAFLSCGSSALAAGTNANTLVACGTDAGMARGQNCAMGGQTCGLGGPVGAACGGPAGFACDGSACFDKTLHWCAPAPSASTDIGVDCADNGAQLCAVFPSPSNAQWAACVAGVDPDASAACTPSTSAACDGGIATSCPGGVAESLDCAALLGNGGGCAPGPLSPPFDWTSPCEVSPPACSADACDDAGVVLTGCARGAAFPVDCAEAGLGACALITIGSDGDAGAETRAACAPP